MKDISIAKQRELQLLHLVSRAERGALLPEEAQQLREAITAGAAARSSAGGMQTRMAALRAERDQLAARLDPETLAKVIEETLDAFLEEVDLEDAESEDMALALVRAITKEAS